MINLSTRNYQLLIGGLDCSAPLISIAGGYGHRDQSGLIKIDGSLELKRCLGWTEEPDDRVNSRWARGTEVRLFVADSTDTLQPVPALGFCHILDAEYDGISTLRITVGCKLSLLDYRTPPGEGLCFQAGSTPVATIAQKLLQEVGISDFSGGLPGTLECPTSKYSNESYIALFGKLCWSRGYYAFQDRNGQIKTRPVNLAPAPLVTRWVKQSAARYDRLTGAEKPCEKIKCSGVALKAKPPTDDLETIAEQYGPASMVGVDSLSQIIVRREKTEESTDRNQRQIVTQKTLEEPLGAILPKLGGIKLFISEQQTQTKYYEKKPVSPTGETPCTARDEGRLVRIEEEILRPYGVVQKEWLAKQGSNTVTAGLLNLVTAEKNTTVYTYLDIPEKDDQIGEILKIVKESYQPIGALLPDDDVMPRSSLRLAARQVQIWQKLKPNEDDWQAETTVWECRARFDSKYLEELEGRGVVLSLGMKLGLAERDRQVIRSNSGQAQPPAPERFPAEVNIKEEPVSEEVPIPSAFGSSFREREREFQIDGGMMESQEQARLVAQIEGALLWGRYKGCEMATALDDALFAAEPLAGVHWVEPTGTIHSYLMDGLTVAFSDRQIILAADGIWCGIAGQTLPDAPLTAPADPPTPTATAIAPVQPPYKLTFRISVRGLGSVAARWFPAAATGQTQISLRGSGILSFLYRSQVSTPAFSLNAIPQNKLVPSEVSVPIFSLAAVSAKAEGYPPSEVSRPSLSLTAVSAKAEGYPPSEVSRPYLSLTAVSGQGTAYPAALSQPATLTLTPQNAKDA